MIGSFCRRAVIFSGILSCAFATLAFTIAKLDIGYVLGIPLGERFVYAKDWHEQITATGLSAESIKQVSIVRRTKASISFDKSAIFAIRDANAETDSTDWDKPAIHFDNDTFKEASTALIEKKRIIVAMAKAGNFPAAHWYLGFALHTLQDFYAHSNWIEKNGAIINPDLGRKVINNPPEDDKCDSYSIVNGAPLTSGFFHLSQLAGNTSYNQNNYPSRCIHGSSKFSNIGPFPEIGSAGINKDNENRKGFGLAKGAAEQATTDYVIDIIQKLDGDDDALCGLLGRQNETLCSKPPIAKDDAISTFASTTTQIDVKANDYDPDGTPRHNLTIVNPIVVGGAAKGSVQLYQDRLWFTPATGVTGQVVLQYALREPSGAVSNTASVTVSVTVGEYRLEFSDGEKAAAACRFYSGVQGYSPVKWSFLLADFTQCETYVEATAKCIGPGCNVGLMGAITKYTVTARRKMIYPGPLGGGCPDVKTEIDTGAGQVYAPGPYTIWTYLRSDPSSSYLPTWWGSSKLGIYPVYYNLGSVNIVYPPTGVGYPYADQCIDVGLKFELTIRVFDRVLQTYTNYLATLSLPR